MMIISVISHTPFPFLDVSRGYLARRLVFLFKLEERGFLMDEINVAKKDRWNFPSGLRDKKPLWSSQTSILMRQDTAACEMTEMMQGRTE